MGKAAQILQLFVIRLTSSLPDTTHNRSHKNVYAITGTISSSTFSFSSSISPFTCYSKYTALSSTGLGRKKFKSKFNPAERTAAATSELPTRKSKSSWAIWSQRPTDPSNAPAIIISPIAYPLPDVVQQALDIRTPAPSLPPLPSVTLPVVSDKDMAGIEAKDKVAAVVEEEKHEVNGNETESNNGMPHARCDNRLVKRSFFSYFCYRQFVMPGSPATSATYVSLPTVVDNGTIPLKGDGEVLDERSTASITAEATGTVLTTSGSTITSTATATTSTPTATSKTTTTTTPLSPAPPKNHGIPP